MDYRIGTCSQCGAEYKVPASFAHNQARCKKCPGTVNLGEVQGAGGTPAKPAPMPAKKVVSKPKPMEEVSTEGADSKRQERGTLAKLRAERAAAAAKEAKQPAAPKPEPVAPEAAVTKVSPRSKAASSDSKPSPKKSARSSSRPARGSSRGKSKGKGKEARAEGAGRRGRGKEEKKKSPMALIAILLVIGGAGFGAWKFFGAADDGASNETQAADNSSAASMEEQDAAMDAGSEMPMDEGTDASMEEDMADNEPADDEAAPEAAAAPAEAPKDVVADLSAIERCNPARGTTDEEWAEMNDWLADFLDADSGAAGPRAGKKLENEGRKAMPVLINGLLSLDYTTEAGINTGDTVQRMLRSIANGNSFGWWYFDNPRAEYLCTGAAAAWQKAWKQVETNIEAYIKLAKLDREHEGEGDDPLGPLRAKRQAEAAELRSMYGNAE